ncbi:MAG: tRNA pseudouridine(55) synthase TruB [Betaproteobacteria bacterium RIFCSPLOWO2_12_FULL_62_13b]|nr:MAG: tRNA pseudouridine(55) synthase TruB [Betaproteobacteria bacterium RIFCSPLOWO2_12_FULL_62_13b]
MRNPRHSRRIDGVLLLDKPAGLGSNAALQHIKRLYRAQRAGHTGTLDPMASGLLPVCLGEATKFAGGLLESDKAYRAELMLGVCTTTGDAEGEVISNRPVSAGEEQVRSVLERFRGSILQVPPMYSALKREGKPLYAYAREGRTLDRVARPVTVHALDVAGLHGARLEIYAACSKGTYIRVLAEDIGEALGCGAHLSGLVRDRIGRFSLQQAHTMDQVEAMPEAERDRLLLPVDALLSQHPRVSLAPADAGRFVQGQRVFMGKDLQPGLIRVYGTGMGFLGTGTAEACGWIQPKRLVSLGALPSGAAQGESADPAVLE